MTNALLDFVFGVFAWVASGAALLGTGAQVSAWAYQADVRRSGWPDAKVPRLFTNFSLFLTHQHDEDRDDVARGRYLQNSVLGWQWLRFAALTAFFAANLQLVVQVLRLLSRLA
ncbi:hypothetical protein [Nocardioides aurantiacus]|uniref:Uncharacterized protein n=1 Tax=Nocardioides aurantiacus TaxID=86796 RepID=A0A3N2CYR0_9ACTN|nr:hypothetical protein [Nocardioides aurantiacus]ROR92593.1 hypothetical protein EDD33_3485 [Nocardioides aurantiacus]